MFSVSADGCVHLIASLNLNNALCLSRRLVTLLAIFPKLTRLLFCYSFYFQICQVIQIQ